MKKLIAILVLLFACSTVFAAPRRPDNNRIAGHPGYSESGTSVGSRSLRPMPARRYHAAPGWLPWNLTLIDIIALCRSFGLLDPWKKP